MRGRDDGAQQQANLLGDKHGDGDVQRRHAEALPQPDRERQQRKVERIGTYQNHNRHAEGRENKI